MKTKSKTLNEDIETLIDAFKTRLVKVDSRLEIFFEPKHYKNSEDNKDTLDALKIIFNKDEYITHCHAHQIRYISRYKKKNTQLENSAKNLFYALEQFKETLKNETST